MNKSLTNLGATLCLLFSLSAWANTAADRAEIISLLDHYMNAVDANDTEALMSTWADEGVLEWELGVQHGKNDIRAALSNYGGAPYVETPVETAQTAGSRRPGTHHHIISHVTDIDGDNATAIVYWFAMTDNLPQTEGQIYYFGHYEDELVRNDGSWLFTKRSLSNVERVVGR